jgi:hypothetical protein
MLAMRVPITTIIEQYSVLMIHSILSDHDIDKLLFPSGRNKKTNNCRTNEVKLKETKVQLS